MVVTGAGSGSGNSKSATRSPAPAAMAERASARGPDAPAARHGLPEVLVVGEAVEPRAEVPVPVPAELLGQLLRPVQAHGPTSLLVGLRAGATLGTIADRPGPRGRHVRRTARSQEPPRCRAALVEPRRRGWPHDHACPPRGSRASRTRRRGRDRRGRAVEIVVVAIDQGGHARHLRPASPPPPRRALPRTWRLTIADHASTDDTLAVARQVAGALLDGSSVVRVPERLDRKAFRARWTTSPAEVAAFLTLSPDTDLDAVLAPLVRHTQPPTGAPSASTPATNTPATDVPATDRRRRRTAGRPVERGALHPPAR